MPALLEVQARVMETLLYGSGGAAALLREGHALSAARRLQVHRNNLFESLGAALGAVYPVLARLVGERCFRQTAQSYVRAHPPHSGTLLDFGAALPAHLRTLDGLRSLPYLPDVAAFEWACHEVYHAAELPPLALATLAALPPEQQPGLRLHLQPCARLIASRYPVLAIWQANQPEVGDAAPPIALDAGAVRLLVVQRALEVEFRTLARAECRWLRRLAAGRTLAQSTAAALAVDPAFDLGTVLARHLGQGLFCGHAVAEAP